MPRATPAKSRPAADPVPLSRERVCREALALVDDEGLEALSMRRLGARLGVEAMSLYRHVRNKADLLDALHVAVLADIVPEPPRAGPPSDEAEPDWRLLLGGMARALRAALLRHPHVCALFATRPVTAPEAINTIESVWTVLEQAGFSRGDAEKAITEIGIFTIGHTLTETQGRQSPHLGSPRHAGQAEFDFGLTALLDGFGRYAGGATPRRPARRPSPRRRGGK
jgi:AcrR family transcriptional regulator